MNEAPPVPTEESWIDDLCREPPRKGLLWRFEAMRRDIFDGIARDPLKMIVVYTSAMLAALSVFTGVGLAFLGGASATTRGSCEDSHRYTIQSGDTLYGISKVNGVMLSNLVALNDISDPDLIIVGDSICLQGNINMEAPSLQGLQVAPERERATGCADGPQPGAIDLRDVVFSRYQGFYDLGIYNCRLERGGSEHSTHAEGRAIDFGTGSCTAEGYRLAALLPQLPGVQRVLFCELEWQADRGWKFASSGLASLHGYTSDGSPPTGPPHIHVELTRDAADQLRTENWIAAFEAIDPIAPPAEEIFPELALAA